MYRFHLEPLTGKVHHILQAGWCWSIWLRGRQVSSWWSGRMAHHHWREQQHSSWWDCAGLQLYRPRSYHCWWLQTDCWTPGWQMFKAYVVTSGLSLLWWPQRNKLWSILPVQYCGRSWRAIWVIFRGARNPGSANETLQPVLKGTTQHARPRVPFQQGTSYLLKRM